MASHRYGSVTASRPTLSDILTRLKVGVHVQPAFVKAVAPAVFNAGGGWISRPIMGDRIYVSQVNTSDGEPVWRVRVSQKRR